MSETMTVVPTKTNKSYLTSGEVGTLLGCSSYWVNILINKGQLDTHRIGNTGWHRISVRSLERYADAHSISLNWDLLRQ